LKEKSTDELWDEYISGMQKLKNVEQRGQQATMYSDEWKALSSEWQHAWGRLSDTKVELREVKPTPHGMARKEQEKLEEAKRMERRKPAQDEEKLREEREQRDFQESIREVRETLASLGKGTALTDQASQVLIKMNRAMSGRTIPFLSHQPVKGSTDGTGNC